ncbi:MAG: hypothetical protein M0Q48_08945 [Verrucomicrobia bacterium]|nr:hypothetical protein [Verrucomicrobiota bacterium]
MDPLGTEMWLSKRPIEGYMRNNEKFYLSYVVPVVRPLFYVLLLVEVIVTLQGALALDAMGSWEWDRFIYFAAFIGIISISISILMLFFHISKTAKYFQIIIAVFFFMLLPGWKIIGWHTASGLKEKKLIVYERNCHDMIKYISYYRKLPESLFIMIDNYASFFSKERDANWKEKQINFRLTEPFSGKTNIVSSFDGSGGWVYNPEQGIFGINVKGMEQYTTNFTEYLGKVKTNSIAK